MRTRTRRLLLLGLLVLLVVLALTVPLPTPTELRAFGDRAGPWAPLAFFALHAAVTTTPVPRTAFSLASGLIFGPVLGVVIAVAASMVSAVAGFALSRRLGGRAIARLGPARVRALEARLCERELLTVVSSRMVGIPFAPLNYTLGVTSVRWRAYLLGTFIGLLPGTSIVVFVGDVVSGDSPPAMIGLLAISGALGLTGILISSRGRRVKRAVEGASDEEAGTAATPDRA